jgi:hypothetical protein
MKNKNEKYHTVKTVPKSNLKIIETEEKIDTLVSYRHFSKRWRG